MRVAESVEVGLGNVSFLQITGRSVGAFASATTAVLWLLAAWSPDTREMLAGGVSLFVACLFVVLCVVGVIASVRGHGNVMLIVFLLLFLPVGAVLLRADHWMRWIGVFNLLLLCGALLTRWTVRRAPRE
jgi:hypothetical protein